MYWNKKLKRFIQYFYLALKILVKCIVTSAVNLEHQKKLKNGVATNETQVYEIYQKIKVFLC